MDFIVAPSSVVRRHGDDDRRHLAAVLAFAGCDRDSGRHAAALLSDGRTVGTALALDPVRLEGLGLPPRAAAGLVGLHGLMLAALRREVRDQPVIAGAPALQDYLHAAMAHLGVEEFRILFLDNHRRLIRDEAMGRGTVDGCRVYVREIVGRALELRASGMVLVHNHPSGSLVPSRDDIEMTKAVVAAAKPLDITVHEHVIVGTTGHASLRALGHL